MAKTGSHSRTNTHFWNTIKRPTKLEQRLLSRFIADKPIDPTRIEKIAHAKKLEKYQKLIRGSKSGIIKKIATAILNARHNKQISIPEDLKPYLRRHNKVLSRIVKPGCSVESRRRALLFQRGSGKQIGGAFPLVPLILSTVLPVIGSAISAAIDRSKQE
jgi:putative cell wall-binding protein